MMFSKMLLLSFTALCGYLSYLFYNHENSNFFALPALFGLGCFMIFLTLVTLNKKWLPFLFISVGVFFIVAGGQAYLNIVYH